MSQLASRRPQQARPSLETLALQVLEDALESVLEKASHPGLELLNAEGPDAVEY